MTARDWNHCLWGAAGGALFFALVAANSTPVWLIVLPVLFGAALGFCWAND